MISVTKGPDTLGLEDGYDARLSDNGDLVVLDAKQVIVMAFARGQWETAMKDNPRIADWSKMAMGNTKGDQK